MLACSAAPRSAPESTLPVDVSGLRSIPGPIGAPREDSRLAGAPPRYVGLATWYCLSGSSACTAGHGEADLVAAIDDDLGFARGDRIVVRHGDRSVTVEIVDACACPGERLVDLTSGAFARLAPLGAGVIEVTIELAGPRPILPATSTED